MLMKREGMLIKEESCTYTHDENTDEEGELKIDLDYHEYAKESIEEDDIPLDLSVNHVSANLADADIQNVPKLDIKPNLIFSKVVEQRGIQGFLKASKNTIVTEADVEKLLDPFVKYDEKKFSCTVCETKFSNKIKALAHVENKHVDCLQYKCPLCRGSKSTRLAYVSHIRRGHGANVKDYSPIMRCKHDFFVKSETHGETTNKSSNQNYDFEFVTFLRDILTLGQEVGASSSSYSWHRTVACEWVEKDQGVFRINNRQELITRWCSFKVSKHKYPVLENYFSSFNLRV